MIIDRYDYLDYTSTSEIKDGLFEFDQKIGADDHHIFMLISSDPDVILKYIKKRKIENL